MSKRRSTTSRYRSSSSLSLFDGCLHSECFIPPGLVTSHRSDCRTNRSSIHRGPYGLQRSIARSWPLADRMSRPGATRSLDSTFLERRAPATSSSSGMRRGRCERVRRRPSGTRRAWSRTDRCDGLGCCLFACWSARVSRAVCTPASSPHQPTTESAVQNGTASQERRGNHDKESEAADR